MPAGSVVKINAITVPAEHGEELARRFASRAGEVDRQDGFEGFELLRPTDDRTTWLVVTHWRDEASFQAWMESEAFRGQHQQRPQGQAPLAMTSELWSFEVASGKDAS